LVGARRGAFLLLGSVVFLGGWAAPDTLRRELEHIVHQPEARVGGVHIASRELLPAFYQERAFEPAWSDPGQRHALLVAIRGAEGHGLDPAEYHLVAIERQQALLAAGADPTLESQLDVILTDALIRLLYHLEFGRVDPMKLDGNWTLVREIDEEQPLRVLLALFETEDLGEAIASFGPQDPIYLRLRQALARYRAIQAAGGWPRVPEGPKLERGTRGERVRTLRKRLQISGDLAVDAADSPEFDDAVEAAVRRFQERHFLEADGVAGKGTLAAMNVPVEARVDQIRVNLERARWALEEVRGDLVLVDIAGFEVMVYRDSKLVWQTRAQVGRPFRATPVFHSTMKYLVLNPTWTVPPGILSKDVLPAVRKDPGYLERKHMRVLDRAGKAIDPSAVDWSGKAAFPYTIRQDPGPWNALGRIKFMFPNPHFVFLHDTPSRSLFDRNDRAFSSGRIRVQKPFELAALLLDDPERWSREQLVAALDTPETQSVFLDKPVTVVLLYFTVRVRDDDDIRFKRDLYDRDPAVLRALDQGLPPFAAGRTL
jgi:murein L,D-transpeptidase YcbB/YkuD